MFNSKKLTIILSGKIGDIIICLPIAKYYYDKGYTIYWPIYDFLISNFNQFKSRPLDVFIGNLMFYNLKFNLCRRKPWGAFLIPESDEQEREKILFDVFNIHTENKLP